MTFDVPPDPEVDNEDSEDPRMVANHSWVGWGPGEDKVGVITAIVISVMY